MLGFADLDDLDLVSAQECARRLGFGSIETMRRALRRKGGALPRPFLRGRYRAADLKDWFLLYRDIQRAGGGYSDAPAVISLDARRLQQKLARSG